MRIIHDKMTLIFDNAEPGQVFRVGDDVLLAGYGDATRLDNGDEYAPRLEKDNPVDAIYPDALLVLEPTPAVLRRLADEMEGEIEQGESDDEGWIEWRGGLCPAPNTWVEVRFRDGDTTLGGPDSFSWGHSDSVADIVAYRVVKP